MSTDLIAVLNNLTELTKDGEHEFHRAANAIHNQPLKLLLSSRSNDCILAARELQDLVRGLGGKPKNHGSMMAALHRSWLDMKTIVSRRSDQTILSECEHDADVAEHRYRMALGADLPADIRQVVERQYQGVVQNHDRIREMRNQYGQSKP